MKGHKSHKGRPAHAKGGKAESPMEGEKDSDEAPSEVYAGKGSNVNREALERKRGGKAKKMIGKAEGEKSEKRADRKPRKAGGSAGSNGNPLSSAAGGEKPKGRKDLEMNS